jgi:DNA-binding GntR family transcriptional regulator
VQAVLEGLAAKLVAEKRDDVMLQELNNTIDAASREFDNQNNPEAIRHSRDFHHNLWKFSGNSVVISMLNILKDRIALLRQKTLLDAERMKVNLSGHRKILAAIADADGAEAERLMIGHIGDASTVAMKKLA